MKKLLILVVLLMFFAVPVEAKQQPYGAWPEESRPWWDSMVKVNPDRAGAKYIFAHADEHFNIYDGINKLVSGDWAVMHLSYTARDEYTHYAEKFYPLEYGGLYYRASKYMQKIVELAKELGDKTDVFIKYAKLLNKEKEESAQLRRKELAQHKIEVVPQIIDGRKWVIGDVLVNEKSFVFEYIPQIGPRIDKANEIFGIEFVNKTFAKDLAEYGLKFRKYNVLYAADLWQKFEWEYLKTEKNALTWYWGFGKDDENIVMAVKSVEDGYFRVVYTRHNPISKEDVAKWQKIVEERIQELK